MVVTLAQPLGAPAGDAIAAAPSAPSQATLKTPRPRTRSRRPPMEKFVIEGGVPLSGTIVPAGNKNGALPILAACLLTDDEVILRNVPRISDVEAMVELLALLGCRVEWRGPGEVAVRAETIETTSGDRSVT